MIYLDNAATTGHKPKTVINAVNKALTYYSANPGRSGHTPSLKAANEVYKTRKLMAEYLGTEPQNVCFTGGCTAALNIAIKGLKEGHIVCSNMEHNSVMRPLYGKDYSVFSHHPKEAVKENTVAVVCTAASNVTGKRFNIKEIGEYCKQKGLTFIVDGAQAGGVFPINCENIDYLCLAPHKGFYAPMGLGVIVAKKPPYYPLITGGTGSFSESAAPVDFLPDAIENGTVNLPAIMGLYEGIKFVKNKDILGYETMLTAKFYEGLKNIKNVTVVSDKPNVKTNAPIVLFNINGMQSEAVSGALNNMQIAVRGGLHCAPAAHRTIGTIETGGVRVSPSVFNTKAEIDKLLVAVGKIAKTKF